MIKKLSVVMAIIYIFTAVPVFAQQTVDSAATTSKGSASLIIDGRSRDNIATRITSDGVTLISLVDALESLGVPKDKDHFFYGYDGKTVTIRQDKDGKPYKTIVLTIGSKAALVNNTEMPMPAYARFDAGVLFVPARFIAETLGRKVVWDEQTQSIFIREADIFNNSKEILQQSARAMQSVKKVAFNFSYYSQPKNISSTNFARVGMSVDMLVDMLDEKVYYSRTSNINAESSTYEYYLINGIIYASSSDTKSRWEKWQMGSDFGSLIADSDLFSILREFDDRAYAGLQVDEVLSNDKTIVLSGKLYVGSMNNTSIESTGMKNKKPYDVKFYIDRNTYYLRKADIRYSYVSEYKSDSTVIDSFVSLTYSQFNEELDISLPRDAYNDHLQTIGITGAPTMFAYSQNVSKAFMGKNGNVLFNVMPGGSDVGILSVLNESANIGAIMGKLETAELDDLKLKQYIVGYQSAVIMVSNENLITNLTSDQLRGILSGKITNWKAFGGPNCPIVIYQDVCSTPDGLAVTSFETQHAVMDKEQPCEAGKWAEAEGIDMGQENVARGKDGGIWIVSYNDMNNKCFEGMHALSIDSVPVTEDSIRKGAYPISLACTYIVKGVPAGWTKEFIDFVLGKEGQQLLKKQGVIPAETLAD